MRKISLFFCITIPMFVCTSLLNAQAYQWGLRTGYTLSYMQNIGGESPMHGFHLGATFRYSIGKNSFFIPSLLFENNGFQHKGITFSNSETYSYDCSAFYLTLPLSFQRRITITENTRLLFSGGVYLAMGISGTCRSDKVTAENNTKALPSSSSAQQSFKNLEIFSGFANRWDYGLEGGVGVSFYNFDLTAHYNWGVGIFHSLPDGSHLRYSTWRFSLAYYL